MSSEIKPGEKIKIFNMPSQNIALDSVCGRCIIPDGSIATVIRSAYTSQRDLYVLPDDNKYRSNHLPSGGWYWHKKDVKPLDPSIYRII